MEAILALQKQHLQQWQQAVHADHVRQRQQDATIILSLHYSHSSNLLFAGTHRGTLHVFHASSILPPPSNKAQPVPSSASFLASFSPENGGVHCMDSTAELLVTGGDDRIHVWSLDKLRSLGASYLHGPTPLWSIIPAQYRLAGQTLTAVPRTLSVLTLPSSIVSSHSNHHVLVTDTHTGNTVADLTCASHPPAASSTSASHSLLYLPEPYHVLLTGGADGYVRVYDCTSWRLVTTYDVTDNAAVTEASKLPSRPAILALSTAASTRTTSASPPASIILALTAASTLHAFYYPSLIALPPLPLTSPASLLHSSLLLSPAALQRIQLEPLRAVDVRKYEEGDSGISACCVRYGDRAAVDDVWFIADSGGRIRMLGCMGSVEMGSLQCRSGPKGPPPIVVGSQLDNSQSSNFRQF